MSRTYGLDLLQRLSDGRLEQAPTEYLQKTRDEIASALEELLDVGARIRPLLVEGKRVGWIRGVFPSERRYMQRWVTDEQDQIEQILLLGTSLTPAEVSSLSLVEMRSLGRLIRTMTDSDIRLFAFLGPFVSTSISEQLWFAKGQSLTNFTDRVVRMPDGLEMRLTRPSDHATLWAALCNYRITAKTRLDASMNSVLIVRSWVGKGADTLAADLKSAARELATDSLDVWRDSVKVKPASNFADGWAHSEDDSPEGVQRELKGMLSNDRHEQLMAQFEAQERARAEEQQRRIDETIAKRGGVGFIESTVTPMTDEQVRQRDQELGSGRVFQSIVPDDPQSSVASRLAKYSVRDK